MDSNGEIKRTTVKEKDTLVIKSSEVIKVSIYDSRDIKNLLIGYDFEIDFLYTDVAIFVYRDKELGAKVSFSHKDWKKIVITSK